MQQKIREKGKTTFKLTIRSTYYDPRKYSWSVTFLIVWLETSSLQCYPITTSFFISIFNAKHASNSIIHLQFYPISLILLSTYDNGNYNFQNIIVEIYPQLPTI